MGEGVGGAGGDKYRDTGVDVDAEGVLFGAVGGGWWFVEVVEGEMGE